MGGKAPKPAALRQRRNKKPGARVIGRVALAPGRIPDLFERPCSCGGVREEPAKKKGPGRPRKPIPPCGACQGTGSLPWHALTMRWWRDVWLSEVAPNFLGVDHHGLFRLAILIDRYWVASDAGEGVRELAAEIRLQQQAFGLTPLDRSRLQWEVEDKSKADAREESDAAPVAFDSRDVLRALK